MEPIYSSLRYGSQTMGNRTRKAALLIGVVALLMQATVGFALSIACVATCADQASIPASSSHGHCKESGTDKTEHSEKADHQAGDHECRGSCSSVDAYDGVVPPNASALTLQVLVATPAILPPVVEVWIPQISVNPGIYAADSGPPLSSSYRPTPTRAPPVA